MLSIVADGRSAVEGAYYKHVVISAYPATAHREAHNWDDVAMAINVTWADLIEIHIHDQWCAAMEVILDAICSRPTQHYVIYMNIGSNTHPIDRMACELTNLTHLGLIGNSNLWAKRTMYLPESVERIQISAPMLKSEGVITGLILSRQIKTLMIHEFGVTPGWLSTTAITAMDGWTRLVRSMPNLEIISAEFLDSADIRPALAALPYNLTHLTIYHSGSPDLHFSLLSDVAGSWRTHPNLEVVRIGHWEIKYIN